MSPSRNAYKSPSRLNWLTVVIILLVAAGIYAAVKFGPPYWTQYKVDEILTDTAFQAIDLASSSVDRRADREQALCDKARARIVDLGIEADRLEVYFEDDVSAVHADYSVVVDHPVMRSTVLEFQRRIAVPQ